MLVRKTTRAIDDKDRCRVENEILPEVTASLLALLYPVSSWQNRGDDYEFSLDYRIFLLVWSKCQPISI